VRGVQNTDGRRSGLPDANTQEKTVSSLPSSPPEPPDPKPFLTLHTVVVLLVAFAIGSTVGGLTYLNGTPVPGATLAGLLSAGGSVPVLRHLIQ
jgi:hypothetical protein